MNIKRYIVLAGAGAYSIGWSNCIGSFWSEDGAMQAWQNLPGRIDWAQVLDSHEGKLREWRRMSPDRELEECFVPTICLSNGASVTECNSDSGGIEEYIAGITL